MRWVGHVACKLKNAYKILVGKPEGKRPLWSPMCRWTDTVIMDLREIGCEDVEQIHQDQDRD
jgi:hypothetical protein